MYKVISTGSHGNAVIYHGSILVDCGVPFSLLEPYVNDLQIILLTHSHNDHINLSTIKKIQFERPSIRLGCCEWMVPLLEGVRNIDVFEIGELYDYGPFQISPIKLYHDVLNNGYRIFKDDHKTIHATDTAHLEGITAKDYDLFAIEHNHDSDYAIKAIEEKQKRGEFAYEKGSLNSHLSEQQAADFIFKNMKDSSQVLRLHESKSIC